MQRACPGLSAKVRDEKPPVEVDYPLTPFGRRFVRLLDEVKRLQAEVDREGASMSDSGARGRRRRGILPS